MLLSNTSRSAFLIAVVLIIATLALFAARAEAVHSLFFSEAFTTDLGPDLEDLDGAFTVSGGVVRKTSHLGNEERSYVRTKRADYFSSDWVYTIDFDLVGNDIVFIGIGEGVPNAPGGAPTYNEPRNAVFFRAHTFSFGSGGIHVAVMETGGWTSFPLGSPPIPSLADGPHTARIEKLGSVLEFSIDGVPGVHVVSIPTDATFLDDTISRLFFGNSGTDVSYDNMVVEPHPASLPPPPPPTGDEGSDDDSDDNSSDDKSSDDGSSDDDNSSDDNSGDDGNTTGGGTAEIYIWDPESGLILANLPDISPVRFRLENGTWFLCLRAPNDVYHSFSVGPELADFLNSGGQGALPSSGGGLILLWDSAQGLLVEPVGPDNSSIRFRFDGAEWWLCLALTPNTYTSFSIGGSIGLDTQISEFLNQAAGLASGDDDGSSDDGSSDDDSSDD